MTAINGGKFVSVTSYFLNFTTLFKGFRLISSMTMILRKITLLVIYNSKMDFQQEIIHIERKYSSSSFVDLKTEPRCLVYKTLVFFRIFVGLER